MPVVLDTKFFQLEHYPLLDIKEGITALGSEAAVKDMIPLFIEKAISAEEIVAFHAAYANKDWEKVTAIAHKLKGACIYCGVTRMRYACHYIEQCYQAGNKELLDELCKQFLTVLDQTKEHVADWVRANP